MRIIICLALIYLLIGWSIFMVIWKVVFDESGFFYDVRLDWGKSKGDSAEYILEELKSYMTFKYLVATMIMWPRIVFGRRKKHGSTDTNRN